MTISTQDCKDFISSISKIIGASDKDKWKRTKKYKDNNLILRDFESQDGRVITVAESQNSLSVYQIQAPIVLTDNEDGWGKKYLGRNATSEDIKQFLSNCIAADPEIVYDDADTLTDASNSESWKELWVIRELSSEDDLGLYYVGENGKPVTLNPKNIKNIHVYFMPNHDTAYRITVFETEDNYLLLGNNDPD